MEKKSVFQGYDIRGIYPNDIDADLAYKIAQAYVEFLRPKEVVIGCDVRLHSEELKSAMIKGLLDAGVDVIDIGCIPTEMIYYAVGHYGYDGGIQVTASHLPAEWHGAKFVKKNAEPISRDNGLLEMEKIVTEGKEIKSSKKGNLQEKNLLEEYCQYALSWIEVDEIKPLKIVVNANFGIGGVMLDRLMAVSKLPIQVVKLNYEPDGNFPKGRPDPYVPENRGEFVALVRESKADFGVAWDSDADRVFFCADSGIFLEPYYANTLLTEYMLKKNPSEKVVYDPRNTRALIDIIKKSGGEPIESRVGHAFIKLLMRQKNALFSGESSGHTYYRDFWYADSGLIPFLQMLEILSISEESLSSMIEPVMKKYVISGEKNFKTDNPELIIEKVLSRFNDGDLDKIDGISIDYPNWRMNLRISNTGERLLRLNMEANSKSELEKHLSEVLSIIDSPEA